MFRPSYPDNYDSGQAVADALAGTAKFYFREVRWVAPRWWQLRGKWVDTGVIWTPSSGEFDVIDA